MEDSSLSNPSASLRGPDRALVAAIALLLAGYGAAAACGVPQTASEQILVAAQSEPTEVLEQRPPLWTIGPFVALLAAIAVFPLAPGVAPWWESHWNRLGVVAALSAAVLAYYLFLADFPVEGHWPARHVTPHAPTGWNVAVTGDVLASAILAEYLPFIVLLFSLYTISGGIRIQGDLRAHPSTNTAFLAVGSVLASVIGTTGAAMLLIRPLLETNRERRHVEHTVVFFIFIVCNCGGCLLPTGDPPLFLGYLLGVEFFWTLKLWPAWLLVNGALLAAYYAWDRFWFYARERPGDIARDESQIRPLRLTGLWPNAILLPAVILTCGLLDPGQTVPGTDWRPWPYLREGVQLGLVGLSLLLGGGAVRRANRFNYAAIIEVAVLFFGIFICMQPALQILGVEGRSLGLSQPAHFFWATGSLSSVLDNAPTYVVFFEAARSVTAAGGLAPAVGGVAEPLLTGVSLGAVFLGAMTYIGNGPNFMVKAIAEQSGVRMPGFFGYMLYSGPILLPLFAVVTVLLLR